MNIMVNSGELALIYVKSPAKGLDKRQLCVIVEYEVYFDKGMLSKKGGDAVV